MWIKKIKPRKNSIVWVYGVRFLRVGPLGSLVDVVLAVGYQLTTQVSVKDPGTNGMAPRLHDYLIQFCCLVCGSWMGYDRKCFRLSRT